MEKKSEKIFIWLLALVVVACLIPLYIYAYYTVPLADDFNMAAPAYKEWLNSGSFVHVVGVAWQQAMIRYKTWAGEYICMFLQGLPIGLGSCRWYFLSSWIILSIYIAAVYYFGKVLLIDYLHTDRNTWFILSSIIFLFMTIFIPDVYDAFYWHTSAVSYTLSVAVKLIVSAQIFNVLLGEKKVSKVKGVFLLVLVFLVPGIEGSFSQTSFFMVISMICFAAILRKKIIMPVAYWITMVAGWLIVLLAPGNMVRQSDYYGETTGIPMVIWESLQRGASSISDNMSLPLLLITLLILPTAYKAVKQTTCKFRFPGIITLFSVGIYGASFAPWVFSRGVEAPDPYGGDSGYVCNVFWMTFVILWFFNVIYWMGWGVKFFSEDRIITAQNTSKKLKLSFYGVLLFMGLFWSMKLEHVMDYTSPRLLWHILNGNAEHYYTAMLEREAMLLDNPDELLVVPEIEMPVPTSGAGDITEDADNWVNKGVQAYYGLTEGVQVQKEEMQE